MVELAVAVAGSRGGGGPTVVTSQREWRPAGRRGQRESTIWRQKRKRKQNKNSERKAKKRGGDRAARSTSTAVDWGPGDSGDAAKHAAMAAATSSLRRTADWRAGGSCDACEPAAKPENSCCPPRDRQLGGWRQRRRGRARCQGRHQLLPPPPRLPTLGRATAATPPSLVTKRPPPPRPSPSAATQGRATVATPPSPATRPPPPRPRPSATAPGRATAATRPSQPPRPLPAAPPYPRLPTRGRAIKKWIPELRTSSCGPS